MGITAADYRAEVIAAFDADYDGNSSYEDMLRLIELGVKLGLEAAAAAAETVVAPGAGPSMGLARAASAVASVKILSLSPTDILKAKGK